MTAASQEGAAERAVAAVQVGREAGAKGALKVAGVKAAAALVGDAMGVA